MSTAPKEGYPSTREPVGTPIRHIITLSAILLFTVFLYSKISTCYFCGFDDFIEVRRAAFVDKADPIKIFTTTHYNSFKYRPLNRGMNLLTYLVNEHSAVPFRIRNLFFQGLSAVALYWLGWLLFDSYRVSTTAALLFAISPLANQEVIGSVMTNTMANSLYLLSLALFIWALRTEQVGRLLLALVCGAIAVYTYESDIVGIGLMAAWMGLDYLFNRRLPSRAFLLTFLAAGGLLYGSYLGVRHFVVVGHIPAPPISGPGSIISNVLLYAACLLSPIDPVLAAAWLGIPMPKELLASGLSQLLPFENATGALGVFLVAGVIVMILSLFIQVAGRARITSWVRRANWQNVSFLILAMGVSILPLVLFTDHPSETYIYLPDAFYCLFLGSVLASIRPRVAFSAAVGAFVVLSSSATWVRNEHVARCARTAKAIVENLPGAQWKQGPWRIHLAKAPGEISAVPYGFYNYYGLDTIGMPGYGADAFQFAMQLAYGNEQITADACTAEELTSKCALPRPREACYKVHWNGQVSPIR